MTNIEIKPEEQKPSFIKKTSSPFSADPYNKRSGGKGGRREVGDISANNVKKIKSISVPKFKGGSGGDR